MRMRSRAVALAGLLALNAQAVDWKAPKPQGYVSDFAETIDPASRSQLEAYCAAVERATGAEIALVTVPTLDGEPVEDVANALFRAWGVGKRGKNEGVLLLLAIRDRRSRLEVGYGLEPVLPDGFAGSVLRQMRSALRQERYGYALLAAAATIGTTVAQAKHTTVGVPPPAPPRHDAGGDFPWGALIAAALILSGFFLTHRPRGYGGGGGGFWTGLILGNLMSRGSWGGRGSGGFGGFDSGDSFGGFGGGDSGGGGASSDW